MSITYELKNVGGYRRQRKKAGILLTYTFVSCNRHEWKSYQVEINKQPDMDRMQKLYWTLWALHYITCKQIQEFWTTINSTLCLCGYQTNIQTLKYIIIGQNILQRQHHELDFPGQVHSKIAGTYEQKIKSIKNLKLHENINNATVIEKNI